MVRDTRCFKEIVQPIMKASNKCEVAWAYGGSVSVCSQNLGQYSADWKSKAL